MAISNTHIKQLELGTDQYYISAKYLLDNSSLEHSYEDIKQLIDEAAAMHNLELRVVDTLPTAGIDTLNAIYLVPEAGTQSGVYTEYVTIRTEASRAVAEIPKFSGSGTPTHQQLNDEGVEYKTDYSILGNADDIYGGVVLASGDVYQMYSVSQNDFTVWIWGNAIKTYQASSTEGNYKYVSLGITINSGQTLEFPVFNSLQDIIANIDNVQYTYTWEKIGTTATDLSEYSLKTHIHTVTPSSMSVSATAVSGSVTFNTSKALGTNATFTTTVTPTTTNIKATASGAALSTSDADFVNGVTSSNASFLNSWGASVDANGVLSFSTSSTTALTGITPTTNKALISASVSTQPTVSLGTGTGTGTVSVATGITSATTTTNSHDEVNAYTSVNVFTQPTIKINNADSVNVAAPTQVNTSSDTTV